MDLKAENIDNKLEENLTLRKGFKLDDIIVIPYKGEVIYQEKHYHLPPNSMQLLLLLAQNHNEILSPETCLEHVWGDKNKNRNVLIHAISDIRNILHDHIECPEFIQTIPRKGYRLIAKLSLLDDHILYQNFSKTEGIETHSVDSHWTISLALFKNSSLFKVSVAFIISTWVLLQVFDLLLPIFNLPDWWMKAIVLLMIVSFPLVLILTWLREIKVRRYLFAKYKNDKYKKFFFKQITLDFVFISLLSLIVGYLAFTIYEQISDPDKKHIVSTASTPINDKVIAVLPFEIDKKVDIPDYFKATLQSEIINALSHQNEFNMISMRALREMKSKSTVDDYIERFGVRYLIDGRIEKNQNDLDVRMSILDTTNLVQIWTTHISGKNKNLLELQQNIYQKLFNAFRIIEKNKGKEAFVINTKDFNAYDNYVHGKDLMQEFSGNKNLIKSQQYFMKSLKADPNFSLAIAGLCQNQIYQFEISNNIDDFKSAKNYCERLLAFKNLKADAYIALGDMERIRGQYQKSIDYYDQSLQLNQLNSNAILGKAQSENELGNLKIAENLYAQAIQIEPGYWKNYLSLGDHYFFNGKYLKATQQYQQVVLLKNNYEPVYNRLGAAYFLSDHLDESTKYWNKALQLNPSAEMYTNVGTALFFRHHFEESVRRFEKAVALKPNNATMWSNLGDALKYTGEEKRSLDAYQKALEVVQKSASINPKMLNLKTMQLRYLSELDQCQTVNEGLTKLDLTKNNDPYIYYDLAIATLNCNLLSQSKNYLDKAVKLGYSETLLKRDIQFVPLLNKNQEGVN